jgi:hypothetical protein
MTAASIFYPILTIVLLYILFKNIKKSISYKKENMQVLLLLNEDDRRFRLMSRLLMAVMILLTGIMIRGLMETKTYTSEDVMIMAILPVLVITLYIPLSKKTMISTLGIHKRSNLIRWADIKGINYLKPDEKNKVKVKIVYMLMNKDVSMNLTFLKDDPQLEDFKEHAKSYKNGDISIPEPHYGNNYDTHYGDCSHNYYQRVEQIVQGLLDTANNPQQDT